MQTDSLLAATGLPLALIVFVLGALVGSFLNVVIARLPYGESIVTPRSRCPACATPIPGWWNIPILSWVLLRGRCRSCKAGISVRYPIVELLTAVLYVACLARFGPSLALVAALILTSGLVAITFIDIDHWEIPDQISIPGIVIGLVLRPLAFDVPFYSGVLGATLGAAMFLAIRWGYYFVRRTEGMGLGDVKLIAMIGAFLGPYALLPAILVASFSGAIVGILLKVFRPGDPEVVPSEDVPDAADLEQRARVLPVGEASAPSRTPDEVARDTVPRGSSPDGRIAGEALARSAAPAARDPAGGQASAGDEASASDEARPRGGEAAAGDDARPSGTGAAASDEARPRGGVAAAEDDARSSASGASAGDAPPEPTSAPREVEPEAEEEEEWVPPPSAVPFGPFLAIGAIAELLFAPTFQRILFGLGLF